MTSAVLGDDLVEEFAFRFAARAVRRSERSNQRVQEATVGKPVADLTT